MKEVYRVLVGGTSITERKLIVFATDRDDAINKAISIMVSDRGRFAYYALPKVLNCTVLESGSVYLMVYKLSHAGPDPQQLIVVADDEAGAMDECIAELITIYGKAHNMTKGGYIEPEILRFECICEDIKSHSGLLFKES